MSTPIDVLAVMDDMYRALPAIKSDQPALVMMLKVEQQQQTYGAARAAVAELIEALDAVVDHTIGCEILLEIQFTETLVKARAALARVRGAA